MTPTPGPRGSLLLGNLREFSQDMLGFFTRSARDYGDVVRLRLADRTAFLVNHPAHIETVLVRQHERFIKHRFFWSRVRALFGQGLVASEGAYWRQQRLRMQPSFNREHLARYTEIMVAEAEEALGGWRDGERRDLHEEFTRLTLRIALRVFFGAEPSQRTLGLARAFTAAAEEIILRLRMPVPLPDWVPTAGNRRYLDAVRQLEAAVYAIIAERRRNPDVGIFKTQRPDLLGALLAARDEAGRPLSDRQLRDEAITMLLAGHETTALTLVWTWYLLARDPGAVDMAVDMLEAEARGVLGGCPARAADLDTLPYTRAVVQEGLRLYPPAYAIGREARAEVRLDGHSIPKGATVFMSPWVMHRDPRYYEEPEVFRPERWLGDAPAGLPRFAYFPFGGGARVCIGNTFALCELVLVMATIARQGRIHLTSDRAIAPRPLITLRPAEPINARFVLRGSGPR
ncbi:MAG: cytochrome P450 [Gammaproteobacteria bacterium]